LNAELKHDFNLYMVWDSRHSACGSDLSLGANSGKGGFQGMLGIGVHQDFTLPCCMDLTFLTFCWPPNLNLKPALLRRGPGSSVSIVTDYGLDGPG